MKRGEKFEHLAAEVFSLISSHSDHETIEHDVMLDGFDGPRQIDVLISGKVGPFEAKTIVECKDYKKNVNVIAVDALHSKLLDVKAQKAVLVARKGFTNGAKKKAQRLGISLCTLHSMEHEKWKFELEIPILIEELSCEKYTPSYEFTAISDRVLYKDMVRINDISVVDIVAEYWNSNEIECPEGLSDHVFKPSLEKPNWIYVADGRKVEIHKLKITMKLSRRYYLGFANNLKSAKYIHYLENDRKDVLLDPNELANYRDTFSRYSKLDEVPAIEGHLKIRTKILHNTVTERKAA
jgi:hypothetical protein